MTDLVSKIVLLIGFDENVIIITFVLICIQNLLLF